MLQRNPKAKTPGGRSHVTLRELAEKSGFSLSTVSSVMNGSGGRHSEKTKSLVQKAARELGYHPDRMAQAMRKRRTKTIGIIFHEGLYDTATRTSHLASKALLEKGYQPLPVDPTWFSNDRSRLERFLVGNGVEGLLVTGSNSTVFGPTDALALAERVPLVGISAMEGMPLVAGVRADVRDALAKITRHLVETGSRRIVMISNYGPPESDWRSWIWQGRERFLGFTQGLGLDRDSVFRGNAEAVSNFFADNTDVIVAAAICKPEPVHGTDPYEQAANYMRELIAEGVVPDAIVCQNDHWAIGVIQVLLDAGIKVPAQVAVTGFDDTLMGLHHPCPITTFRQPLDRMADWAVSLLLSLVEKTGTGAALPIEQFQCEMILRRSTDRNTSTSKQGDLCTR